MTRFRFAFALLAAAHLQACGAPSPLERDRPCVATFECDVTPPIGHPLTGGSRMPADGVESRLLAKGIVIDDGRTRCVLCAVDWCRIQNDTYDLFRSRIAAAAGIPPSNVAVQCTHAHEAPLADTRAQLLLASAPSPPTHLDLAFTDQVTRRIAESVRRALPGLRPFTHVGFGKGRVQEVASNSRVRLPGGRLVERPSVTTSAALQAEPEGTIDPWVRTITLLDGGRPLVRMHYYACHPENTYTNGKISSDLFGPLREDLERTERIPNLYFAACGGDVGMGKYHVTPAEECRSRAVQQMVKGIREAIRGEERAAVSKIGWKVTEARLVTREDLAEAEAPARQRLADPAEPGRSRIGAALTLSWIERVRERPGIEISCLRLGPVSIVHLPGEPFVEFQLYAQSLSAGFVAVAGYGDGGPGYVCTDLACREGGYQPSASKVGPPSESILKQAIADVLR
jgi:hypothetical protein